MMNGDLHDISKPVEPEDDRELWALLAKAKQPEVSPYFSRRVLREAALLPARRPSSAFWRALKAWWQAGLPLLRPPRAAAWPSALVATFICVISLMMNFPTESSRLWISPSTEDWQSQSAESIAPGVMATPNVAKAELSLMLTDSASGTLTAVVADGSLTQQDAEVIADLDNLMAREETHLWTDDNAGF